MKTTELLPLRLYSFTLHITFQPPVEPREVEMRSVMMNQLVVVSALVYTIDHVLDYGLVYCSERSLTRAIARLRDLKSTYLRVAGRMPEYCSSLPK